MVKVKKASNSLSQTAYAKRIGVSRQYVGRLVREGRLLLNDKGRIDPLEADARMKALRRPERDEYRTSVVPDVPTKGDAGEDYANYTKARAIKEDMSARLKTLEYEEASGQLVKKSEVRSALFVAGRTTRDSILAIPRRISAMVATESDREKIETLMMKEFRQALTALAEDELAAQFGGAT